MKKEAQTGIIVTVVIILICILSVIILYNISNKIANKSKSVNIDPLLVNINIEKNIIINNSEEKIQISLSRGASKINMDSLKAVVIGDSSYHYVLSEVPKEFESKTYVLNKTGLDNIREIIIYPVINGEIGTGKKDIVNIVKNNIESNSVINPENKNSECISLMECESWSECHVIYSMDNIISNNLLLKGEQTRLCKDKNKCIFDVIERKDCDPKVSIMINATDKCSRRYLDVFDEENNLISRLDYADGVLNIQFIFNKPKYYSYCFNGIKDCDEDGVDCVNTENGSCPVCND